MLWWIIGIWLTSGIILPVCYLLSMAYHWLVSHFAAWAFRLTGRHPSEMPLISKLRQARAYLVAGAIGVCALVLLFAGSSSEFTPDAALARATAAQGTTAEATQFQAPSSVTLSPALAPVSTKPVQAVTDSGDQMVASVVRPTESSAPREADGSVSVGSKTVVVVENLGDTSSDHRAEDVVTQPVVAAVVVTAPIPHQAFHKALRADHWRRPARVSSPSVQPSIPRSSGAWPYAPNGGTNG